MPDFVIEKILEHLPLHVAAKTSILCHHNGRIHSILLDLRPSGLIVEKSASLSQWLSLLSRTCPKKIALINDAKEWSYLVSMPSYIFHCTELTKLKICCFVLYAPPFEFKGFPCLRTLELLFIKLKHGIDMLRSLVAKCPCLVYLRIEHVIGVDLFYVEAPWLEKLTIKSEIDSISLKNCPRLVNVSQMNETVVAAVTTLATSCELQCLGISGNLCKFLAAHWIDKSLPLAFNHLSRLCLVELMLRDPDVFCFTIGMIQSCPIIKELEISMSSNTAVVQQKYECVNDNYKLNMLHDE